MPRIMITARWMVGGIRTYVKYFYRNADPAKYELAIVAPRGPETDALLSDLAAFAPRAFLSPRDSYTAFVATCARALSTWRPTVVHSQGFSTAFAVSPLAAATGVRHVTTVHDVLLPNPERPLRDLIVTCGVRAALGLADKVIAVGEDVAQNLQSRLPRAQGLTRRVTTIPNGVDPIPIADAPTLDLGQEADLPTGAFVFGYMGRFMAQKGFATLRAAMEQLVRGGPLPRPPIVVAIGSGGFEREEKALTARSSAAAHFRFLPFSRQPASILKAIDALVMPSRWEALPLLPMEAMIAGTPVIGTDCIGLREVLRDTPARVVPAADAASLAEAMRAEIMQPSRNAAKLFAPIAADRFTIESRRPTFWAIIDSLAARDQPYSP